MVSCPSEQISHEHDRLLPQLHGPFSLTNTSELLSENDGECPCGLVLSLAKPMLRSQHSIFQILLVQSNA